jgi:hypothetical protein
MEDTIILLGDSSFIKDVEEQLFYVLDKYKSIGINRIVNKYPTTYQVFLDERMISTANAHPDIPTISLKRYGDLVRVKNKELFNSYSFDFKIHTEKDIPMNNKLPWCGFTHDFALSYVITKGWKNVVLIGAADMNIGSSHYSVNMAFTPSDKLIQKSKRFIEKICTQRANIFTCNPNSLLTVERVSIEDLLT